MLTPPPPIYFLTFFAAASLPLFLDLPLFLRNRGKPSFSISLTISACALSNMVGSSSVESKATSTSSFCNLLGRLTCEGDDSATKRAMSPRPFDRISSFPIPPMTSALHMLTNS